MNEIELAWAAGFFDGEGSAQFKAERRPGRYTGAVTVSATQLDREPLDRFARAVGVGNVRGPYRRKNRPGAKPSFAWTATGSKAAAVMEKLWPYLSGPKKRQYEAAVTARSVS